MPEVQLSAVVEVVAAPGVPVTFGAPPEPVGVTPIPPAPAFTGLGGNASGSGQLVGALSKIPTWLFMASSSGLLTALTIGTGIATAALAAEGVLAASASQPAYGSATVTGAGVSAPAILTPAAGSGSLAGLVTASAIIAGSATGTGTGSATQNTYSLAGLGAGTGSTSAAVTSYLGQAVFGRGSGALAGLIAAIATVTGSGAGSGTGSATVTMLTPMSMYLTSNFATTNNGSTVQVTPWTANSAYPGTVITSGKMVVVGSGQLAVMVTVTLTGTYPGSSSYPMTLSLTQNSTVVGTATIGTSGHSATITQTLTVANGDTIWLQESTPSFGGAATIASGSANTSITVQPVLPAALSGSGALSATVTSSGGTPAVSVVASSSLAGQSATITVTKPSGVASGDMLIAIASCDSGTSAAMTAPSGWTLLTSLDEGSSAQRMKVWTLQAGASEPSTYSFGQVSAGADGVVTIVALRNALATTGSWLYATPTTATNGTSIACPSVSGAASGAALLCAVVAEPNGVSTTMTAPSGMTLQASTQSTSYNTQGVATLLSPANPTGTKSFGCSSNTWFAGESAMVFSVVVPHS